MSPIRDPTETLPDRKRGPVLEKPDFRVDGFIEATSLLNPPRRLLLQLKAADEILEDVSRRLTFQPDNNPCVLPIHHNRYIRENSSSQKLIERLISGWSNQESVCQHTNWLISDKQRLNKPRRPREFLILQIAQAKVPRWQFQRFPEIWPCIHRVTKPGETLSEGLKRSFPAMLQLNGCSRTKQTKEVESGACEGRRGRNTSDSIE